MADEKTAVAPADARPTDPIAQTIERYNRAVRLAKLNSIILEKVDFKVTPEALNVDRDEMKREINVETAILGYEAEEGSCIGNITWSIAIRHKRKRLVKCSASYIAVYEIKNSSDDVVKMFIDNVGKTATYAYFRALFSQLDWAATIGSPPLPLLQFLPKISKPKGDAPAAEKKKLLG